MPSIFSKIISGDIPCYKIAETERYFAFLDISPLKKGHVLVIPKTEVDDLFDLNNDTYSGLMSFAKHIAIAIKKAIPCNRIAVSVIGLEVPHAHIHLIPINTTNDINFTNTKLKLSQQEFEEIARNIMSYL